MFLLSIIAVPYSAIAQEEADEMPDVVMQSIGGGFYVNTLNLSAGPMFSMWPLEDIGFQATYGIGTYTTYEARGLYRMNVSADHNFYLGLGYIHAEKNTTVIDTDAVISGDGLNLIAGMEKAVFKRKPKSRQQRRLFIYIEFVKPYITLEEEIRTTQGLKKATVDYRPFSIGTALAYYPW